MLLIFLFRHFLPPVVTLTATQACEGQLSPFSTVSDICVQPCGFPSSVSFTIVRQLIIRQALGTPDTPITIIMATLPLPADEDRGPMLLVTIFPFLSVALLVYIIRIFTRLCALTAADYTITVAMIAYALSVGFTTIAIQQGFGKHTPAIPNGTAGLIISNSLFGAWMTGVIVSGFARISVASLLLSISRSPCWKCLLWGIITLQLLFVLSYEIVQLVQLVRCRVTIPPQPRISQTQCFGPTGVLTFAYISITMCTLSDCICAIIPAVLVVNRLSAPKLEKALIIVLMVSCLFATVCGIPKIYFLAAYDTSDAMWDLIPEFIWCRIEEGVIIIAACAPLLKRPIQRVLGVPTFGFPIRELNEVESEQSHEGRRMWSA